MKRLVFIFNMVLVCGALAGPAQLGSDVFSVVAVTDTAGEESFQVLSRADFQTLQKTIHKENVLSSQALTQAAKEWNADETSKGIPFPRQAIQRRMARSVQTFKTSAQAEARLAEMEESKATRADTARYGRNDPRNPNRHGRGTRLTDVEQKRLADQQARDQKKKALDDRARSLFEKKLSELIAADRQRAEQAKEKANNTTKPAPDAAPDAAPKADPKADPKPAPAAIDPLPVKAL